MAKKKAKKAAATKKVTTTKKTAGKRSFVRHAVKVDGKPYPSIQKAFDELGLSLGTLVRFRLKLKEAGTLTHEGHKFVLEKK